MKIAFGLSAMILLLASTEALAFQQTPPRPPLPEPNRAPIMREPDYMNRINAEMYLRDSQRARTPEEQARLDLANQVGVLMDQGKCDEARALARAEGDRQMALRVRQICRPARN